MVTVPPVTGGLAGESSIPGAGVAAAAAGGGGGGGGGDDDDSNDAGANTVEAAGAPGGGTEDDGVDGGADGDAKPVSTLLPPKPSVPVSEETAAPAPDNASWSASENCFSWAARTAAWVA